MPDVYIALGANLGDREKNISRALDLLRQTEGAKVISVSSLIENPAVGGPADSPPFLNAAAKLEYEFGPRSLLVELLHIEKQMGRNRKEKWEPRLIDLDILLFNNQVVDSRVLKIPHPLMHTRRFVLQPLAEIAPNVVHPILKKTMQQLLNELP